MCGVADPIRTRRYPPKKCIAVTKSKQRRPTCIMPFLARPAEKKSGQCRVRALTTHHTI